MIHHKISKFSQILETPPFHTVAPWGSNAAPPVLGVPTPPLHGQGLSLGISHVLHHHEICNEFQLIRIHTVLCPNLLYIDVMRGGKHQEASGGRPSFWGMRSVEISHRLQESAWAACWANHTWPKIACSNFKNLCHRTCFKLEDPNFMVGEIDASIIKPASGKIAKTFLDHPWPNSSLAVDTSNSAMMSDHAATSSLLGRLPWLILPNNIRHLLSNVVDHCELNLTCLTTQIPGFKSGGLSCEELLPCCSSIECELPAGCHRNSSGQHRSTTFHVILEVVAFLLQAAMPVATSFHKPFWTKPVRLGNSVSPALHGSQKHSAHGSPREISYMAAASTEPHPP